MLRPLVPVVALLLMVIGQVIEYRQGAVKLLGKDDPYHLVREGHLRQRNLALGSTIYLAGESVGPSDDEYQSAAHRVHALLQPVGKSYRGKLLASLVEQYHMVARLQLPAATWAWAVCTKKLRTASRAHETRVRGIF